MANELHEPKYGSGLELNPEKSTDGKETYLTCLACTKKKSITQQKRRKEKPNKNNHISRACLPVEAAAKNVVLSLSLPKLVENFQFATYTFITIVPFSFTPNVKSTRK